MSLAVELDALRAESDRHATAAYLVTVGDAGAPHVVSVTLTWDGDELVAAAGRTTVANAAARAAVTVVWPPGPDPAYSLIVDAEATASDGQVRLRPTSAVLHRVADAEGDGPTCRPVGDQHRTSRR